nr:MAG TPA: hypothetical protein [Bacteriophage sp.]
MSYIISAFSFPIKIRVIIKSSYISLCSYTKFMKHLISSFRYISYKFLRNFFKTFTYSFSYSTRSMIFYIICIIL